MPSTNPHPTAVSHYRTLDILRRQHTAIHSIVHSLEHGGSIPQAKRDIASIIAALAIVQTEIN